VNFAQLLVLLVAANATPWMIGRALGDRWALPLDLGIVLPDGERMFGSHKTWRGLIAGAVACALAAKAVGIAPMLGLSFGVLSLLGDVCSSAFKRRLHWPPGKEALVVDQLPECLLPLAVLAQPLDLGWEASILGTVLFVLFDLIATRLRHRPVGE
jgi:CDP-2,3-bis-(O-geranylgeranyl)-sn-glycerol synthase